jgi:hypothetical protein
LAAGRTDEERQKSGLLPAGEQAEIQSLSGPVQNRTETVQPVDYFLVIAGGKGWNGTAFVFLRSVSGHAQWRTHLVSDTSQTIANPIQS